jgi:DNA-binding PucR family transcriptional regulator
MSLRPTLDVGFHENGNLMTAAQRLALHRTHRIQRMEALCGLRLENSYDRLDISIALMIWRHSA